MTEDEQAAAFRDFVVQNVRTGLTDSELLSVIAWHPAITDIHRANPTPGDGAGELRAEMWPEFLGGPSDVPLPLLIQRARQLAEIAGTGKMGELTQPYAAIVLTAMADALASPSMRSDVGREGLAAEIARIAEIYERQAKYHPRTGTECKSVAKRLREALAEPAPDCEENEPS